MSKRKLVLSGSFIKAYKKFTAKKPSLRPANEKVLLQLKKMPLPQVEGSINEVANYLDTLHAPVVMIAE